MKHFVLFVIAVVMTCLSSFAFSGKGGGTEKDPYQITNADEFFEIRNELDANYKLMNDIDLAEFIKEDNPAQGWSPIGNTTTPFTGSLNGNNMSVKGLFINRPTVENIGMFGCVAGANIKNMAILNPRIIGMKNVGSLAGLAVLGKATVDTNIENIIVQNTDIFSDENSGGLIGAVSLIGYEFNYSTTSTNILGCAVSGTIESKSGAGGLLGYATSGTFRWYESSYSWGSGEYGLSKVFLYDNIVDVTVISDNSAGGLSPVIEGWNYNRIDPWRLFWMRLNITANRNIVRGSVTGNGSVCGFVGKVIPAHSYRDNKEDIEVLDISNNVAAIDMLCNGNSKDVYKITNRGFPNNYSYSGMEVFGNKTQLTLEDNDYNGTSYGLKVLKKRTTYEGMGFDFGTQWAIKEGETFPYNINQSEMPEITEFIGGSRAYISGKASGTGKVYVFIGGNLFESFVVDNQWKVDLGNIPVGNEAKVSVALDGKIPSIQVSAVAELGTTNPTVKAGDANGDGEIDAADVVAIINHIIGKNSSSFNALNADVNGDGQVLVDDAVGAVELIMNAQ